MLGSPGPRSCLPACLSNERWLTTLGGSLLILTTNNTNKGFNASVPKIEFEALVELMYGATDGKGAKVLERYPVKDPKDCRPEFSTITTNSLFHCPNRAATRGLVKRSTNATTTTAAAAAVVGGGRKSSTWRYLFDHAGSDGAAQPIPACRTVSCHAADLPFFWADPEIFTDTFTWTPAEVCTSVSVCARTCGLCVVCVFVWRRAVLCCVVL